MAYDDPYADPYGGNNDNSAFEDQQRAQDDRRNAISGFYTKYLGRDADEGGLNSWAGNTGLDLGGIEAGIRDSAEGKAYASRSTAPTAAPPTATKVDPGTWLNWIHSAYGDSASRGGGFADLPSGQSIGSVIDRFNKETGSNAKFVGGASGDMVDFGNGARDVLTSGGQLWWDGGAAGAPGAGKPASNPNVSSWAGQGSNGNSSSNGTSTSTSSTTASSGPTPEQLAMQAQREAMRKQLFEQLSARSKQGLEVGRDNPQVRGQADAYSANEERSKRNYLADLAEQSGPISNLRAETRLANERVGQRTGAMEQSLMANEVKAKRDEIAQALSSQQALLSTDDQLALQKELAQMDDTIKRLGLAQNNSQFGQSLGLDYARLGQAGSQFDRTLGTQNDQFLANFGRESTNDANYWDWMRTNGGR